MVAKKSICVLISGGGSNLQAIIDSIESGRLNARICGVVSNNPDAYGLIRAQQVSIPTFCIDHRLYDSREDYDKKLAETIRELAPDCVVLAGFMRILTPDFVTQFEGKLVNIHPSLLPKYKGLNTHQRAIDNNDEEHGVSVHFVTPELDGGPVIIQSRVPVFVDDDADTLAARVQEQEHRLYPLVMKWICEERLIMRGNQAILDNQILPPSGYAND